MKTADIGPYEVRMAERSGSFTVHRGASRVAAGEFKNDALAEYRQAGASECPSKGAVLGALRAIASGDTVQAAPVTPIEVAKSLDALPSYEVDMDDGAEVSSARAELRALASRRRQKKANE